MEKKKEEAAGLREIYENAFRPREYYYGNKLLLLLPLPALGPRPRRDNMK